MSWKSKLFIAIWLFFALSAILRGGEINVVAFVFYGLAIVIGGAYLWSEREGAQTDPSDGSDTGDTGEP
jgi:hypothetical protein